MAKSLNQYNSDIENGDIIKPEHITQFVKAFTGEEAYDIEISGSLKVNGKECDLSSLVTTDVFYGRGVLLDDYDLDLSLGENFTKVYVDGNSFTLSNPTIGKKFRLFLSGGTTLTTPTFYIPAGAAYTTTWMASTLAADYNGTANVLYCEIRSAGTINLFWGE